jgi:GNAT superfamily N-acetyltransferase
LTTDFAVVTVHPALVKYAVSLQAQNSNALGFLPACVFERGAEAGQLFLGLLNGEPCGYVLAESGYRGIMRCRQTCIRYDARRRLYGAMLVVAVEKYGEDLGCWRKVVRCASDLDANEFWRSMGYTLVGTEPCGQSRKRYRSHINIWHKVLHPTKVVTKWKNGRPRVYASNAARQKTYRQRRSFVTVPACKDVTELARAGRLS